MLLQCHMPRRTACCSPIRPISHPRRCCAVKKVVEATCHLDLTDATPLTDAVYGYARAHAEIFQEAYTKCSLEGGDDEYDGGCALSTAFTESYAEACAEVRDSAFAPHLFSSLCRSAPNIPGTSHAPTLGFPLLRSERDDHQAQYKLRYVGARC